MSADSEKITSRDIQFLLFVDVYTSFCTIGSAGDNRTTLYLHVTVCIDGVIVSAYGNNRSTCECHVSC